MGFKVEIPRVLTGSTEERLSQISSYLFRLAEYINTELGDYDTSPRAQVIIAPTAENGTGQIDFALEEVKEIIKQLSDSLNGDISGMKVQHDNDVIKLRQHLCDLSSAMPDMMDIRAGNQLVRAQLETVEAETAKAEERIQLLEAAATTATTAVSSSMQLGKWLIDGSGGLTIKHVGGE